MLPGLDILKVKLAPGKYDRDGFPVTCYEGFRESVAQLANQFTDLPIYCAQDELEKREKLEKAKKQGQQGAAAAAAPPAAMADDDEWQVVAIPTENEADALDNGKFQPEDDLPRLRTLYLVLDEFSGYAMYYAAILKGFGLEDMTRVVCFRQGKYEDTALLH